MKIKLNRRILGAVIGATLIGLASAADACTVTWTNLGTNPSAGDGKSTWVQFGCTVGTWYGAWGYYSNDEHVQNIVAGIFNAKVLGWSVNPTGNAFDWNTVYISFQ